jgi:hypothetical protein
MLMMLLGGAPSTQSTSSTAPQLTPRQQNLLLQLSDAEANITAINRALKDTGYRVGSAYDRIDSSLKSNEIMDRNGGGPVRWDEFYGKTAKDYPHTWDDRMDDHRPQQFAFVYQANNDQIARAQDQIASLLKNQRALLDRRQKHESDQSRLWATLAWEQVMDREIEFRPLYRFALQPAGPDAAVLRPVILFLHTAASVAGNGLESIQNDQTTTFAATSKRMEAAYGLLQKSLADSLNAADLKPDHAKQGQALKALCKALAEETKVMADNYANAMDRDKANEDASKLEFRGLLQRSISSFATQLAKLDDETSQTAVLWSIKPVMDLANPDLARPSQAIIPASQPVPQVSNQLSPPATVQTAIPGAARPVPAVAADAAADPTDNASLLRCLDSDYQFLLKTERDAQSIRNAAQLLEQTNQNSHWNDFFKANELLRQHRAKAAVPLLMMYMVKHAAFGSSHISIPQYVQTLRVLTGEKIADPPAAGRDRQQSMDDFVINLYVQWWKPIRATLTTDLARMSDEQISCVADELLRLSESELGSKPSSLHGTSTQAQYEKLVSAFGEKSGRQLWWDEDLHPRMVPIFLAAAGYSQTPTDDVTDGPSQVSFAAAPLLAVMHQNNWAGTLDQIAADAKQNNATRLTCLLALYGSGRDVNSQDLVSIFDSDKRLECRVVALLMLGRSATPKTVAPQLVTALDDDNREIRLAALTSLRTIAPRDAKAKLLKVISEGQPQELIDPGLLMLSNIGGDDVVAALVQFMQKSIDNGNTRQLPRALEAFSNATHKRWLQAGAHPQAYYQTQANAAIADWKAQHP